MRVKKSGSLSLNSATTGVSVQLATCSTPLSNVTATSLAAITSVLKSLLADGISLTHSVRVFSSLSQAAQRTSDPTQIVELMRSDLGTLLVGSICGPDQRLPVITLAAQLEEMVVGGMQDPTTGEIVIEPDLARSIGERIGALLQSRPQGALTPALVVQPRARRALASLLKLRAPGMLVLSINELPAEDRARMGETMNGAIEADIRAKVGNEFYDRFMAELQN